MRSRDLARLMLRRARRLMRTERPIVLMYHRVETLACDPWQLAITPERFARQIALLRRERDVVPLSWLAAELREGRLPRRAAAVTFDDGYGDVFRNALPVLRAEGCHGTVFITTDGIGSPDGFWWDVLSRVLLETPRLPHRLSLEIAGVRHEFRLAGEPASDGEAIAINRAELHRLLHGLIRVIRPQARREAIERLAEWAGVDAAGRDGDLAMTAQDLRALAGDGLVEIGAHTLSHPSLPTLPPEDLFREVEESRRECEALIGRPVTGFAYPFGDFDTSSIEAVFAAGLAYACTTEAREIGSTTDVFAIPRLLAADWDEAEFRQEVLVHG